MKSIYYCDSPKGCKSRLVENLKLCNITIQTEISNIDIYKYFLMGFKNFILPADSIDNNALSFIKDHNKQCNILIDTTTGQNTSDLLKQLDGVRYLTNTEDDPIKHINILSYINNSIFNAAPVSDKKRKNILAVFLNNITQIPQYIENNLENNNIKYQIRFFDNKNIKHKYNVGLLSEKEKSEILKTYKYFISIDNNYLKEAHACGIIMLDSKTLKEQTTLQNKSYESITKFIDTYLI